MFAIQLLPPSESDPEQGRFGMIIIGDCSERFACYAMDIGFDDIENVWRSQLQKLIGGEIAVALVYDPRFAWIIYREGSSCFVQQKLSLDGSFSKIARRQIIDEDGQRISEWTTTISAINQFLKG
jgi:hypothetical protein